MPFTQQELDNIATAQLDFHMDRGKVFAQTLQDKPLLSAMMARQKTFPGGKEFITQRVKGEYTTTIMGYSHDDQVEYQNPANLKSVYYPWKEIHFGLKVTMTELKKDGISIVDSANGKGETRHSQRELHALVNLLDDKIEDMKEGGERGMNLMFWRDGTQDSKQVPGIRSIILNDPTTAVTVGGLDQSLNTWWRNRASLGINTATPGNLVLVTLLQNEFRQLRRYGSPKHRWLAGSSFMDAYEQELRSKGNYTMTGWAKNSGRIDGSVADLEFKGTALDYDPTLDDLGLQKYSFLIDEKAIFPVVMEGEDMKSHNPARPADQYVIYRAKTWTGGLMCRQRNTSGVYSIA